MCFPSINPSPTQHTLPLNALFISHTINMPPGHTNYINAIAWDPEGRYVSSVADDNSCIIWTNHDEQCSEHSVFYLKSAGMSVKWHPDDSEKILVAEKKGVIHMYNVVSILSQFSLQRTTN